MAQRENSEADGTGRGPRGRQLPADKYEARRVELAEAALETLGELGYARTSLREIAQKSEFTHAVLHYYFSDKLDLIRCSIRYFKAKCVTRYDVVTTEAQTREELMEGFLEKLAETMRDEPQMHCLWYDLRSQALFEESFREVVNEIDESLEHMVWHVVTRYAELGGSQPTVTSGAAYALLDGLFQKHLLRHVSNDPDAIARLLEEVRALLPMLA
ncbi:TetR/AcrR family transcriptional regulator [Paraburkholderia megapolitana]|uniref:Transcriptional regulator, TetR family n=1 Tax=Paraburkholderia megapolitana TaxID=420953 RepID=A0A1I3KKD5_9BURK|nr:TetR/AcrR family transcriptional regulator [Paraburkholderia megapolitana]QDQ80371.1 TetR/AcrR family transcriptional regulator [Paraburkholderia megapolitana]SFI72788.1 transcriptional regulator, TetR family [Paraburkholderia megapolitana]